MTVLPPPPPRTPPTKRFSGPNRPLPLVHAPFVAIKMIAKRLLPGLAGAALLAGCAASPPAPDWQVKARTGVERALAAYLKGERRADAADWALARREMARTGSPEQVARVELNRCAAQVASLDFAPCHAFEPLRIDAGAAERAYADYLDGRIAAADVALLPPQHQALARASAAEGPPPAASVAAVDDPLARLIAAGVLLRQTRASPEVVALAVDTASTQGWRRPLLAWLGVAERLATQRGDATEAARLRRRIDLVQPVQPPADAASAAPSAAAPAPAAPPVPQP